MRYRLIAAVLCLAFGVLASGCGSTIADESERLPALLSEPDSNDIQSSPDSDDSSPASTSTTTTTTAAEIPPVSSWINASNVPEDKYYVDPYGQRLFYMSDEYNAFLSDTVFVGDSICLGLKAYKYMPPDNVCAAGSVGARNIFDFDFDVKGGKYRIVEALKQLSPKYIVFSMGMNDLNLSNPEKYCANYDNLLDRVHEALPEATLFVASITPISANIDFNNNANIDLFNVTLREHLAETRKAGYLDVACYLKNAWNVLDAQYAGTDGIHLRSSAYSAILYQICEQLVDTHVVSGTAKNGVSY